MITPYVRGGIKRSLWALQLFRERPYPLVSYTKGEPIARIKKTSPEEGRKESGGGTTLSPF